MNKEIISEEKLRKKLRKIGKSVEEIDRFIDEYVSDQDEGSVDKNAISDILEKTKEESVLRVARFNLTQEQYDSLLNYFEESEKISSGKQGDARSLVQKAIKEFIVLLS